MDRGGGFPGDTTGPLKINPLVLTECRFQRSGLHPDVQELEEVGAAETLAQKTEELADLSEVVLAIAHYFGISRSSLEAVASTKRAERGGFAEGLWFAT